MFLWCFCCFTILSYIVTICHHACTCLHLLAMFWDVLGIYICLKPFGISFHIFSYPFPFCCPFFYFLLLRLVRSMLGHLLCRLQCWPLSETFEPQYCMEDAIEHHFSLVKSVHSRSRGGCTIANGIAATHLLHSKQKRRGSKAGHMWDYGTVISFFLIAVSVFFVQPCFQVLVCLSTVSFCILLYLMASYSSYCLSSYWGVLGDIGK